MYGRMDRDSTVSMDTCEEIILFIWNIIKHDSRLASREKDVPETTMTITLYGWHKKIFFRCKLKMDLLNKTVLSKQKIIHIFLVVMVLDDDDKA